jgi:hypothetical protein
VASIVSKATTLPIYQRVTGIEFPMTKTIEPLPDADLAGLAAERRKLHRANRMRATLSFASVALMALGVP